MFHLAVCLAGVLLAALVTVPSALAATTCLFDVSGSTMYLTGDCTTDSSIVIPEGMTLDGGYFTITALDPPAGAFEGGIVVNGGRSASIVNTRIAAVLGRAICHPGSRRLRGIFFDGATGLIRGNTIADVNQGASICNEGNGIEVRHIAASAMLDVEIDDNLVEAFQKTGIVVSGNVDAWIHDNRVGPSATQGTLAANGVQVGFGAIGMVERNQIAGNSWSVDANSAATAVLLFRSGPGTVVRDNDIEGNADIGVHVQADRATVEGNRLFETGVDGFYDVGIGNYGAGNVVTNNKVRGYTTSYEPADTASTAIRIASR